MYLLGGSFQVDLASAVFGIVSFLVTSVAGDVLGFDLGNALFGFPILLGFEGFLESWVTISSI